MAFSLANTSHVSAVCLCACVRPSPIPRRSFSLMVPPPLLLFTAAVRATLFQPAIPSVKSAMQATCFLREICSRKGGNVASVLPLVRSRIHHQLNRYCPLESPDMQATTGFSLVREGFQFDTIFRSFEGPASMVASSYCLTVSRLSPLFKTLLCRSSATCCLFSSVPSVQPRLAAPLRLDCWAHAAHWRRASSPGDHITDQRQDGDFRQQIRAPST